MEITIHLSTCARAHTHTPLIATFHLSTWRKARGYFFHRPRFSHVNRFFAFFLRSCVIIIVTCFQLRVCPLRASSIPRARARISPRRSARVEAEYHDANVRREKCPSVISREQSDGSDSSPATGRTSVTPRTSPPALNVLNFLGDVTFLIRLPSYRASEIEAARAESEQSCISNSSGVGRGG